MPHMAYLIDAISHYCAIIGITIYSQTKKLRFAHGVGGSMDVMDRTTAIF